MAQFNGVLKCTEEQYNILLNGGTITVRGVTYSYDPNTLYVTEKFSGVRSINGKTGEVTLTTDDISDTDDDNKFVTAEEKEQITTNETDIATIKGQYLKNATVSDDTLTITKQDGSTLDFQGGGDVPIETISANGATLQIVNKNVDVPLPISLDITEVE